jgi:hypothetical protein
MNAARAWRRRSNIASGRERRFAVRRSAGRRPGAAGGRGAAGLDAAIVLGIVLHG